MKDYIKFTIRSRFDKSRTPIRVRIFKDYDAYHAYGDSIGVDWRGSAGCSGSATIHDFRKGKPSAEAFEITVNLIDKHIGAGYVCHEMVHAAFTLAKKFGIIETSREETIALHAGELCCEFWTWHHRHTQ